MSAGLRVRLKANPQRVGTVIAIARAKAHHAAILGTTMSFTVQWDGSGLTGLTYGEDVLDFPPAV